MNLIRIIITLAISIQALADDEKITNPRLLRHEPIYIISGNPNTKIQFSAKAGLIKDFDLYLGYTQVMFWETSESSIPFKDVNYSPELFYVWRINDGILKNIDLGFFEHRSNGESGPISRSWNRSYVKFNTEFESGGYEFEWATKFFHFYGISKENHSIRNTLGFVDTAITAKKIFKKALRDAEAQFRILPGGKLDLDDLQGYQEFNFRFRISWERFNPFVFLQVYNGLSETMLEYKERGTSYRIGLEI